MYLYEFQYLHEIHLTLFPFCSLSFPIDSLDEDLLQQRKGKNIFLETGWVHSRFNKPSGFSIIEDKDRSFTLYNSNSMVSSSGGIIDRIM